MAVLKKALATDESIKTELSEDMTEIRNEFQPEKDKAA
jgi:hypothetical protein